MDTHIAHLRLLLATLDGDEEAAHEVIDNADLIALTHYLAHKLVLFLTGVDGDEEHEELVTELRHDLLAQLEREGA
jgi:hypothetical protein